MTKTPIIDKDNILSILLQRPPVVLIDTMLHHDKTTTVTSFGVREDNIFVQNGVLREPGLIENIAQTAAARLGYIAYLLNKDLALGYIGAIKKLKFHRLPPVSSELETEIKITNQVFNVTIAKATIVSNGQTIATCEMKIFIIE